MMGKTCGAGVRGQKNKGPCKGEQLNTAVGQVLNVMR